MKYILQGFIIGIILSAGFLIFIVDQHQRTIAKMEPLEDSMDTQKEQLLRLCFPNGEYENAASICPKFKQFITETANEGNTNVNANR